MLVWQQASGGAHLCGVHKRTVSLLLGLSQGTDFADYFVKNNILTFVSPYIYFTETGKPSFKTRIRELLVLNALLRSLVFMSLPLGLVQYFLRSPFYTGLYQLCPFSMAIKPIYTNKSISPPKHFLIGISLDGVNAFNHKKVFFSLSTCIHSQHNIVYNLSTRAQQIILIFFSTNQTPLVPKVLANSDENF